MAKKNHTEIPNAILEPSTLSVSARLLYCILLKYCRENRYCYPSQETLAKSLGRRERQVRNLLKELHQAGVLNIVVNGYKKVNFYYPAKKKLKHTLLDVDPDTYSISIHTSNTLPTNNSVIEQREALLEAANKLVKHKVSTESDSYPTQN